MNPPAAPSTAADPWRLEPVGHQPGSPLRRRLALAGAGLLAAPLLGACAGTAGRADRAGPGGAPPKVGALFAGRIDDRGFMEAGWRGLEQARAEFGIAAVHTANVEPRKELLVAALADLAASGPDLVIAHGGQNNEACADVAARFPRVKFVVTQGAVTGANLASYEVLQEESAYLAGMLAALSTRTGVIGHMSGIRVRPGLKGRAAYAAGARAANPAVRLLTNFSGNQDDNALSRRVALAQIDAGADVIFTMLNAGRAGVIEACRARAVRQIGNVVDWVRTDPAVFIGSATADVGRGVFEAVKDTRAGAFPAGTIRRIGLSTPGAVDLTLAPDVPRPIRERIDQAKAGIAAGRIAVPEAYDGPEFANPV
jgi:basic membrane protein A